MSTPSEPQPEHEGAAVDRTDLPTGGRSSRRGFGVLGLLIVAVALLATAVVLGVSARDRQGDDRARADAVQAARQTVLNFVSISSGTIDRDLQRVSDGATGQFAEEFNKGKPQVKDVVVKNRVKSTGRILESAVVSSDRDSAAVLVAVDGTVVNVSAPKGQLRHYRIRVDMAKEKNAWRVSKLTFVG
jgi:Mce-associated membrane protein